MAHHQHTTISSSVFYLLHFTAVQEKPTLPTKASHMSNQSLTRYLGQHHQRLVRTTPNGNCLFNSFSIVKYGNEKHHTTIRNRAVHYIRTHPEEFATLVQEWQYEGLHSIDEYCDWMQEEGSWGDIYALQAICKAYQCAVTVIIHTHKDECATTTYGTCTNQSPTPFTIVFSCPLEHYSAVLPKRQRTATRPTPLRRSSRLQTKPPAPQPRPNKRKQHSTTQPLRRSKRLQALYLRSL